MPGLLESEPHRVAVGFPVRNAGSELVEALGSLTEQTHRDLTIAISDNASDDKTREISQRVAAEDPRVEYERNIENIGILPNFNRVLDRADAPLFMWAAHDHRYPSSFVETLLRASERSAGVIGILPAVDIKTEPNSNRRIRPDPAFGSERRRDRLRAALRPGSVYVVYGLFRTDVLKGIGGIPLVYPADVALVASLALRGRMIPCDEMHFSYFTGSAEARRDRDPLLTKRVTSLFSYLWGDTSGYSRLERVGLRLELFFTFRHRWVRDRLFLQFWAAQDHHRKQGRAIRGAISFVLAALASPPRALRRLRRQPDRPAAVT